MGKLLKFEFRKVFRLRYFYIIAAVVLAFTILTGLINYLVWFFAQKLDPETQAAIAAAIPSNTSYNFVKSTLANNFFTFAGIFLAIFACEDNSHGTSKNVIAKGYNRVQVFYSKYIASLLLVILMALLGYLTATLFGLIAYGPGTFANDDNLLVIILGQLLVLIAYHALLFVISYSIGKPGGAIAVCVILPLAMPLIFMAIDTLAKTEDPYKFGNFWIDGIVSNFTGNTNNDLIGWDFPLLFVYLALANVVGLVFARRKQY